MAKTPYPSVALRKAWRTLVPPSLRKYGHGAAIALAQRRVATALARGDRDLAPGSVIVSGFLGGTKGVSKAARLTVEGLRAAGFEVAEHDVAPLFEVSDGLDNSPAATALGGVWIFHLNAPEAITAMSRIDPDKWLGRYRIAFWAYELPKVPPSWVRAAAAFHEVWAPSQFVADALRNSGIDKPIRVMPHPVTLGPPPFAAIPANDDFIVLAMGDLKSSAARKNLIGAIDIYRRAFPTVSPKTRLVLKVQSEEAHADFRDKALAAARGRGDILFRTGSVDDSEIGQLIAGASVLLSPHRSEGFGLSLAEAFLAGVPALATGWSGNLDFMACVPELLIRHTLVPVADPDGIYRTKADSRGLNPMSRMLRKNSECWRLPRLCVSRSRHAANLPYKRRPRCGHANCLIRQRLESGFRRTAIRDH